MNRGPEEEHFICTFNYLDRNLDVAVIELRLQLMFAVIQRTKVMSIYGFKAFDVF